MTTDFWITILVIVLGPFLAVGVTRWSEKRRGDYAPRHDVFRGLMKTRKTWGNPEHAEALNVIEIEHHGRSVLLSAYKNLFACFERGLPRRDDESMKQPRTERHSHSLCSLRLAMSQGVGDQHGPFGLLRGGYSAMMRDQIEGFKDKIRNFFNRLYCGVQAAPPGVVDIRHPEGLLEHMRDTQDLLEFAYQKETDKT